jgi:serine/threonine protein kinase
LSVPERHAPGSYLFGHYEIIETLGQGGMGVVYRAVDVALDRQVVLKVLREDLRHRGQIVARFRREAEAIAVLDHPHIVHIYSVGEIDGIPYMAMEYVEAMALSDVLERDGPMPWPRALEVGAQIASALALAHEYGIIHRDVKPGNVLIDSTGKAYVTDFGIAKVLSAATQLTIEGQRLGTPQYMCPERCRNGEVTPLSDIYSLGVLLFQAISGRLPHEAATPGQLMHRIVTEPAARLRSYVPQAPEDVERLLAFMLEANPRHRPQSARLLQEAISRVRDGRPLSNQDEMSKALTSYQASFNTPSVNTPTGSTSVPKRKKARLRPAVLCFRGLLVLCGCTIASIAILALAAPPPPLETPARLWATTPAVATPIQETASVRLARIAMDGYRINTLSLQGPGMVTVQLDSTSAVGPPLRALVSLDGSLNRAVLVQPPMPNSGDRRFNLLPLTGAGSEVPLVSTGSATVRVSQAPALPGILLTEPCTALAFHPDGQTAAAAQNAADGAVITIVDPATTATMATCTIGGSSVRQLVYGAEDSILAWQGQESGAPGVLHTCALNEAALTSRVLLKTALPLGPVPQHEGTGHIVAAVPSTDGGQIVVLDPVTGGNVLELGKGQLPAWTPNGKAVLALDADRAGRLQLWEIALDAPYARKQLTFVDSGLEPLWTMDTRSATAYSALSSEPTVVRIDLSAAHLLSPSN